MQPILPSGSNPIDPLVSKRDGGKPQVQEVHKTSCEPLNNNQATVEQLHGSTIGIFIARCKGEDEEHSFPDLIVSNQTIRQKIGELERLISALTKDEFDFIFGDSLQLRTFQERLESRLIDPILPITIRTFSSIAKYINHGKEVYLNIQQAPRINGHEIKVLYDYEANHSLPAKAVQNLSNGLELIKEISPDDYTKIVDAKNAINLTSLEKATGSVSRDSYPRVININLETTSPECIAATIIHEVLTHSMFRHQEKDLVKKIDFKFQERDPIIDSYLPQPYIYIKEALARLPECNFLFKLCNKYTKANSERLPLVRAELEAVVKEVLAFAKPLTLIQHTNVLTDLGKQLVQEIQSKILPFALATGMLIYP